MELDVDVTTFTSCSDVHMAVAETARIEYFSNYLGMELEEISSNIEKVEIDNSSSVDLSNLQTVSVHVHELKNDHSIILEFDMYNKDSLVSTITMEIDNVSRRLGSD